MKQTTNRAAGPQPQPSTDELMESLFAAATPEAYLKRAQAAQALDYRGLADYLNDLLEAKGLNRAAVCRDAGVSYGYASEWFSGKKRCPSRDHVIALAFGFACSVHEAQRLLTHAGCSELYPRDPRDAVVLHCLDRGLTRFECDDELYRHGLDTLLDEERP